jgi:hypothetical protein
VARIKREGDRGSNAFLGDVDLIGDDLGHQDIFVPLRL